MTSEEMFADWYASLSPEERARHRRRQRLIDDRLADSERRARQGSSTAADVLTATGAEQLSATERDGYGSGRRVKALSLRDLAKAHGGVGAICKVIVGTGTTNITEAEIVELAKEEAEAAGTTVAKMLLADNVLAKACAVARASDFARQADRNVFDARVRSKAAQLN